MFEKHKWPTFEGILVIILIVISIFSIGFLSENKVTGMASTPIVEVEAPTTVPGTTTPPTIDQEDANEKPQYEIGGEIKTSDGKTKTITGIDHLDNGMVCTSPDGQGGCIMTNLIVDYVPPDKTISTAEPVEPTTPSTPPPTTPSTEAYTPINPEADYITHPDLDIAYEYKDGRVYHYAGNELRGSFPATQEEWQEFKKGFVKINRWNEKIQAQPTVDQPPQPTTAPKVYPSTQYVEEFQDGNQYVYDDEQGWVRVEKAADGSWVATTIPATTPPTQVTNQYSTALQSVETATTPEELATALNQLNDLPGLGLPSEEDVSIDLSAKQTLAASEAQQAAKEYLIARQQYENKLQEIQSKGLDQITQEDRQTLNTFQTIYQQKKQIFENKNAAFRQARNAVIQAKKDSFITTTQATDSSYTDKNGIPYFKKDKSWYANYGTTPLSKPNTLYRTKSIGGTDYMISYDNTGKSPIVNGILDTRGNTYNIDATTLNELSAHASKDNPLKFGDGNKNEIYVGDKYNPLFSTKLENNKRTNIRNSFIDIWVDENNDGKKDEGEVITKVDLTYEFTYKDGKIDGSKQTKHYYNKKAQETFSETIIMDKDGKIIKYIHKKDGIESKFDYKTGKCLTPPCIAEGETKFKQFKSRRWFANLEFKLMQYKGLAGWSQLIFSDEELARWREGVDQLFSSLYLGTDYWASAICSKYIPKQQRGTFTMKTKDGLFDVVAHVEGEKTIITLPNETKQYLYKLTFSVRNPEYSRYEKLKFNVYLYGDRTVKLYAEDIEVEDGKSFTRGSGKREKGQTTYDKEHGKPIVQYSTYNYNKICIKFSSSIINAEGDSEDEVCNAIVEYKGPATEYEKKVIGITAEGAPLTAAEPTEPYQEADF